MRAKIAGGSDMSAGGTLFREIQRPFRWVPDVRWRNHYFARTKEAFPCVRPWTQLSASPRTVYFRWCRSLTMLTMPRRAHPRWWTTARPCTATSRRWEDTGVESQTERCTRFNSFWSGVVWQSVEKNRRRGGVEGWPGQRWSSASHQSVLSRAASSSRRGVVPAALEEEDERLKMDAGRWM